MENRFGAKDFFLFIMIAALIVMVGLAMVQYDRQWTEVRSIQDTLRDQGRELQAIQQQLRRGVVAVGPAYDPPANGENAVTDPVENGGEAAQGPVYESQEGLMPGSRQKGPELVADTRNIDLTDPFARLRVAQEVSGYAQGDWLIDAFGGGVARLTPLISGDAYASTVQSYVLEPLARRDPNTLEWSGLLATEWAIEDNVEAFMAFVEERSAAGVSPEEIDADPERPDPIRIRFRLRQNVRFSDGAPLTADDVVFTFQLIMNEQINAPRHRAYLRMIERVEKLDSHEVMFVFREPYFNAFSLAASFDVMPQHFYSQFTPQQYNAGLGLLLGSGAYRMQNPRNWRPGQEIVLVRNERYWGPPPAFNRLVFKEITNDVARLTEFRNGDIDLFPAQPEQYRSLLRNEALVQRTHHFEFQNPVGGYRYIAWNQRQGGQPSRFADQRVRQAMTMLINRERMIEELMLGYAVQATGPFNPLSRQYNQEVQPWPFDIGQARRLLAEAGFRDRNGDGVLQGPDGRNFEFRLTYPSGNPNYESMALMLKDAFARAGIIMHPDPLEWSVFTQRLEQRNFEAITLGWTSGIETDIYQMFHSDQIEDRGDNFMSYRSEALDQLISRARRTVSEEARMPVWREAHRVLHEEQPYTFLFFQKSLIFMDSRLQNVHLTRMGLNPRVEWFVPREMQRWDRN